MAIGSPLDDAGRHPDAAGSSAPAGGVCIHEWFERQAQRSPDSIALVLESDRVTYGTLNRRANQLAHHLRAHGVGAEVLVGICMERSIEMIVAILGVLKAGGAYVPIDTEYPAERIAFLLADAEVAVLLTQEKVLDRLPRCEARVVPLDSQWSEIAKGTDANPVSGAAPDNVAYVIYTSGSTGRPKGVLVTHRNVVRLFEATWPWYRFDEREVWTLFHSVAFDFSVWEIWGALFYGGRLVIVPFWVSRSPETFYDLLAREQVTVLNQTPSAFRQLIRAEEGRGVPATLALRLVIFGGEALELQSLRPWFKRHGDGTPQLVNMYGITETTVHVTYRPITQADLDRRLGSVIGVSIPDLQMYLLDEMRSQVPDGEPGEVYVGGAGVARGYLKRPELTRERFVPDPFGPEPRGRLYRTGDVARRLPGGEVEYLGRIDQQVKIRGFRIELGEIESVLAEHVGVRECVAAVHEDSDGNKRLVAYAVPNLEYQPATEQLAGRVAQVETIFDQTYSQASPTGEDEFNFIGWNSSYTGELISPEEMREWLDGAVSRILALRPRRVLEIGCGTGMVLFRVAPHCGEYWASDLSQVAIEQLERKVRRRETQLPPVRLLHRGADDFEGLEAGGFDTVVINSVVQLFPSVEYLVKVLEGAIRVVKPNGQIFLGDVRSLPLLEAFHASVELHKAPPSLSRSQLVRRVKASVAREEELVIDPVLFSALSKCLPQIGRVDIQLKRGRHHNELTRFRYDVVLRMGPPPRLADHDSMDWVEQNLSIDTIRRLLADERPLLRVTGVPNARLSAPVRLTQLLADEERPDSEEGIRAVLEAVPGVSEVDPESFWAIQDELPYDVEVTWSDRALDRYDVLFRRLAVSAERSGARTSPEAREVDASVRDAVEWARYANAPLTGKLTRELAPELRMWLKRRLPDYMVPSSLMFLDAFQLTAHGKVDRRALPVPDLVRPELEENYAAPRNPVEEALAEIWTDVLGLERVGIQDNFFDLGGDSILNIQIIARANKLGLKLTPAQLFRHHTIAALAAVAGTTAVVKAEQGLINGRQPLTAIQHWIREHSPLGLHHANLVIRLTAREHLDAGRLRIVVAQLLRHHDALRLRFSGNEAEYAEVADAVPFEVIDLAGITGPNQASALSAAAERVHASLDPLHGPVLRVVLFEVGEKRPQQVMFSIHQLIADGTSIRLLLEDFQTAYQQLKRGQIDLPAKTTSAKYAAERYAEYARSPALLGELVYWLDPRRTKRAQLPRDFPGGANTEDSARRISVSLSGEDTRYLLQEASKVYRTRVDDVLMAALAMVLGRWAGARICVVDAEGHGREPIFDDVDVSRTVGSFTAMFPVLLEVDPDASPREFLRSVKEQLRAVPGRGIGWGLLRYSREEEAVVTKLDALPRSEVLFNYLGQYDQIVSDARLLELTGEINVSSRYPQEGRTHLFEVNSLVTGARLQTIWTYSGNLHRAETVERLAQEFAAALRAILAHCRSSEAGGFTPSDFPLTKLTQSKLDEIVAHREAVEDIYPLSPLQHGMLFHTLYAPRSGIYHIQLRGTLPDLDVSAFERAWQQVVDRHSILRSAFIWEELPEPLQVVQRKARVPLAVQDWSPLSPEERSRRFVSYADERRRALDLSRAPAMSLDFIRVSENTHLFLWNFHHILLDGWSMTAVLEEVMDAYRAYRKGQTPGVEPAMPYRDHIAWMARQDLRQAEAYWRPALQGFRAPTPLPGDSPPRGLPNESDAYAKKQFALSETSTDALRAWARQHRLTLNTLLEGAWGLLLSHWSGEPVVVFGAVVPGRPPDLPGAESIVGLFMNTVAVRIHVDPGASSVEWLQEHQNQQVRSREYEYSPLVNVQEWSEVPRGMPLFESIISVQGYLRRNASLEDWAEALGIREFELVDWNSLPLSIAADAGARLSVLIKYDRRRFEEGIVTRILDDFRHVLETVANRPDATVEEIGRVLDEADAVRALRLRDQRKKSVVSKLRGARRKIVPMSETEE